MPGRPGQAEQGGGQDLNDGIEKLQQTGTGNEQCDVAKYEGNMAKGPFRPAMANGKA